MKQFACGSVVPGCQAVFRAADDDEILAMVAAHARRDHGIPSVPDDLAAAVLQKTDTVPD